LRLKCLDDLYWFITRVLYHQDEHKYGPLHKWLADLVQHNENSRQLYLLPRGHFKTTIITVGYVIQQILENRMSGKPDLRCLILSAKDDHALTMSDAIKMFFVNSPRMRALWPDWCSEKDWGSRSEWSTPARKLFNIVTKREPTVVASGFKSKLASKHYDLIILDDPIDEDDTSELGRLEALTNYGKIVPLLDMGGRLIVVGTRYHYDDLYQRLMDTGAFRVYVRHALELPGTECTRDECARFAQRHDAADFERGLPIAPTLFTRAELEARLREYEADPKRGAAMWWHQYMNIPFAPADQKFKPEWFQRIDDSMIPGGRAPFPPLSKWIAVDTAWKDEEHPSGFDFTVIVVGGFDGHGRLYILDILRDRTWTEKRGIEAITTCMRSGEYGGISRVITEKVGETSWHGNLRDECRRLGIPLQLIVHKRGGRGSKAKLERIMIVQHPMESGRIFFRKVCENYEDARDEFCNLGHWTNDDIADAISMLFDEQVRTMAPPRTSGPDNWKTPARPLGFDTDWRKAAYHRAAVDPTKDPLGRFGREGPAVMYGRFDIDKASRGN
jgi:phage terminase large subunit-like protein